MENTIKSTVVQIFKDQLNVDLDPQKVTLTETRKDFEGDKTVVTFPLSGLAKKSPEQVGAWLGSRLVEIIDEIEDFQVVKGFLNLKYTSTYWIENFYKNISTEQFGAIQPTGKKVVLEYCGPNTNKPLHLGHVRNMLIGWSVAEILIANGHEVHKVNILNDRGIAIAKSMVAWQESANGKTPESEGKKGDHFVGDYYVEYSNIFKRQVEVLINQGLEQKEAERKAPIYLKAVDSLQKWENHDTATLELWNKMNNWVYEGFDETYRNLGVDFENDYKESDTYLLGKSFVQEGLKSGSLFQKDDGSIWIDLEDKGLDEKLLLRSDGTSVYVTQDLGTAQLRYNDYNMDQSIYVVADEQNYHFKVLKLTLEKLEKPYAAGIFHLAYGLVDLPTGRMKSREGTSVDADDLMLEMINTAESHCKASGKFDDISGEEAKLLFRKVGLAALKYNILRVSPKKKMIFNPEESIDLIGNTGPFIQYTYARIQSILKKADLEIMKEEISNAPFDSMEIELIKALANFPQALGEAGSTYDPSVIANYSYHLAKLFNQFYAHASILKNDDDNVTTFRLQLSHQIAKVIKRCLHLLGIEVADRM